MTRSWWQGVTDRVARSGAPLPQRADVVVVGAGLIGVSIARTVSALGASVVLIDAGMPGDGASGELLGICDVGTSWPFAELAYIANRAAAMEVFALSRQNLTALKALVRERDPKALLSSGGFLSIWACADEEIAWRFSVAPLAELGYPVSILSPTESGAMVGLTTTSRVNGGSLRPMGALFQPLRLFDILLEDALASGTQLVTHTRVEGWHDGPDSLTVETSAGRIEAGHVVLACNGGLHELAPKLEPFLYPSQERVAVVRFSRPNPITLGFGIDFGRIYGCMIDDDRGLIGGISVDETPTVASLTARFAPFINAPPIQAVESHWLGTIVDTPDERPMIGRYARRVWVASAYGGQALPFLLTTGELIGAAIARDDDSAIPVLLRPSRFFRGDVVRFSVCLRCGLAQCHC